MVAGFTLIELVVVLAVLGLVIAVLMPPRSGAQSGLELRAAARALADGLARTRDRAVTSGITSVLAIDVEARRFEAEGDRAPTALPADARIAVRTVSGEIASGNRGSIRFFADGGSTGGGVVLSANQDEYRIAVDWLTGRVEVSGAR